MKLLKSLLAGIICVTVIFSACKKNDIFTDRLSVGSLKDSSGNCLPSSVHGDYSAGTTLLVEHYIDVHVNVDSVGAYSIATDSTNGYSFKGTGTFGIKGDNLVRLYGHGTPLFGGVNVFTVRYGSSACRTAVTVSGSAAVPSVFTLDTLAGACPGVVLEGTFTSSIPATAANKAKLGVVVTTPGTYSITTTAINGISFSGTGAFTTVGPQTLVLTANGTPTVSGAFNYTATVNGVSCTYSVTVAEGPSAAIFTLGGSPSTCTGFVLAGTYQAGTGLTSSNTVTCQVNVTTAGAYSLSTTSANGISFSGSRTFTTTGAQTVVLTATGTPTAARTNTFTVNGVSGTCSFSVTTLAGSGGGGAVFTLGGSPATCTGFILAGTYRAGTVLTSSNTVTCQVNVTSAGAYTLSTSSANGISFSGSGTFVATGAQTVVLTGTGTPTSATTNSFTVSGAGGTCSFSVTTVPASSSSSPCTGLTDNKFTLSNGLTASGPSNGNPNTSISPGAYHIDINTLDLVITFSGSSAPPLPGTYDLGTSLAIVFVNLDDLSTWHPPSGKVYVSAGAGGSLIIEFCGLTFVKTGATTTAIGSGKIVLL